MRRVLIRVSQKSSDDAPLSMFNLKDEIVNTLYKDSINNSTRRTMQFYILLYLLSFKTKDSNALEYYFEKSIPKLKKLNNHFENNKSYLSSGDYREIVKSYGLSDFFSNDTFFILADSIINLEDTLEVYNSYLQGHKVIKEDLKKVNKQYSKLLENELIRFSNKRISDYRTDERGEVHDLSKSVYRTVYMRSLRKIDLKLQKYTKIKNIHSNSPIDVTFIQSVDPEIVMQIWQSVDIHLVIAKLQELGADFISDSIKFIIFESALHQYQKYRMINGQQYRKEKENAKIELDQAIERSREEFEELVMPLLNKVVNAQEELNSQIKDQQLKKQKLLKSGYESDDAEVKSIDKNIKRLSNYIVETTLQEK